jgi:FkbM family methyltransferase
MKQILQIMIMKLISIFVRKFHKCNFSTNYLSVLLENCIGSIRGHNQKFSYNKNENIFSIYEEGRERKFFNKIRGFSLYRNGIKNRGKFIFSSYCLQNITFNTNDVIIDCGANYGDLILELEKFIKPSNYIAIEPNPSDFEILKFNANNSILINKALGNSNGVLPFYVSTERGDSSLIEPKHFDKVIDVQVVRLDTLMQDLNLNKIKLLKIEAEGYEPEILKGAGEMLERCEYIAVDGGYERGIHCEQTFTTITNYLLNNNFEIKDIYFPWHRALFIKK